MKFILSSLISQVNWNIQFSTTRLVWINRILSNSEQPSCLWILRNMLASSLKLLKIINKFVILTPIMWNKVNTHGNLKWYPRVVSVPCNVFIKVLSMWSLRKDRWGCCDKMSSAIWWVCQISGRPRLHLDKPLIKALHGRETTLGYHFRFSCVVEPLFDMQTSSYRS